MKPVELPLYPKLSSIYNKILQLVSAILLMLVLMSIWVSNGEKNQQIINQHFKQTGQQFLQQAIAGTSTLLAQSASASDNKSRNALLQTYLNKMAEADFVRYIHLYDETGQLILSTAHESYSSASIKTLYGIEKARKSLDKSEQYVPYVGEIRQDKLSGYVRITLERSLLVSALEQENNDSQATFRILLILAGLIGFLLTRGLNRFSRQGFRMPDTAAN